MFAGTNPHPTGVWLSEFTEPYMYFHENGVEMTVASPRGGQMPIDPRTDATAAQQEEWKSALKAAAATVPLTGISATDYDAIFLPGGHGPMFDLPGNRELQELLKDFYSQGKIISAVCHGPAGLVGAVRADGKPLVSGVTLTSYTYSEEVLAKLDKEVPFILEERLRELGANFVARENKADHIERDGQFITGQNPSSSTSLARTVIAALRKTFPPLQNTVTGSSSPVELLAEFPAGTFLENIAVSVAGEIFVSSLEEGEVYKLDASGAAEKYCSVERPAGLAFEGDGALLIGSSIGSSSPGLYRSRASGHVELAVAMPEAIFLNGLVHLTGNRFLVADSYRSRIWEVDTSSKQSRIWLEHPALAHAADPFHPVPEFPGVNGVRLFGGAVYASSTEQQKIVRVPLNADHSAGLPEVFMTAINLDDFAFDVEGNLYGTTHIYNSVVKITPGRVVTIIADLNEGLAGSTSAAFGRTASDRTTLYVTTNGGMSAPPEGGIQPARVVKIETGVEGYQPAV
jgi:putative intracellular protease/amidase